VVSLALGLYSDFGVKHGPIECPETGLLECTEPKVEWVEGVAIMVAVFIVVIVGSLNDWQKERQFRALNDKKEDRTVKVIRDGKETVINVRVCDLSLKNFLPSKIFCYRILLSVTSLYLNLVKSFQWMVFS